MGDPEWLEGDAPSIIRDLADNGCWIILWTIERVVAYRDLLAETFGALSATLEKLEGRVWPPTGSLILASPNAVVPAHFDHQHIFLLQLEGTKEVTVGAFLDPDVADREIGRNFDAGRHNVHVLPPIRETVRLKPGDGLYIPPYTFHWVEGGPDISVAMSCAIPTSVTNRTSLLHSWNAVERRLRLAPRSPGRWKRRDDGKAALARSRRALQSAGRTARGRMK